MTVIDDADESTTYECPRFQLVEVAKFRLLVGRSRSRIFLPVFLFGLEQMK
jgi:hypothetical protein